MSNASDGGERQCILVTNNEVGEADRSQLEASGFEPGDREWEKRGVFEQVTRPRCTAVVTGIGPGGAPVDGEYEDGTPYAEGFQESIEFFELTYQDATAVELDLAFEAVAPLMWLRAGAQGVVIEKRPPEGFEWVERYGVLWDLDRWRAFVEQAPETAVVAFVVTDSTTEFAAIAAELPSHVASVRLYENYLTTFAINRSGSA